MFYFVCSGEEGNEALNNSIAGPFFVMIIVFHKARKLRNKGRL